MRVRVEINRTGYKRMRSFSDAMKLNLADMSGPLLTHLGRVHRRQEKNIFATEGESGGAGAWEPLNRHYALRKRRKYGRARMLVLSGDMRRRFTVPSSPLYVQKYVPVSGAVGEYQFGAQSDVAAAHLSGDPGKAKSQSGAARRIFGGTASRLPARDMITKSGAQIEELRRAFVVWYSERTKQVVRNHARLIRASKPERGV